MVAFIWGSILLDENWKHFDRDSFILNIDFFNTIYRLLKSWDCRKKYKAEQSIITLLSITIFFTCGKRTQYRACFPIRINSGFYNLEKNLLALFIQKISLMPKKTTLPSIEQPSSLTNRINPLSLSATFQVITTVLLWPDNWK
jgi:hypothetical protein